MTQYIYYTEPKTSPWGEIQHCTEIAPRVFEVSTAGHGGIMVDANRAKELFTPMAIDQAAFLEDGYICFEEDCAMTVAMRELLDKGVVDLGKWRKPEEQYHYNETLKESIKAYYPEYWRYYRMRHNIAIAPIVATDDMRKNEKDNYHVYRDGAEGNAEIYTFKTAAALSEWYAKQDGENNYFCAYKNNRTGQEIPICTNGLEVRQTFRKWCNEDKERAQLLREIRAPER